MHKISILYSWLIRSIFYFLPDIPGVMRLRGFFYSLMLKKCGSNFQVASSVYFNSLSTMEIGNNVYIAHNSIFIGKYIYIEDEVIIGPGCVFASANHFFDGTSYRFSPSVLKGPIIIKKGSWVGANCSLLSGGHLPECSILAAGSILNKRFDKEKSIYAGAPARFVKNI